MYRCYNHQVFTTQFGHQNGGCSSDSIVKSNVVFRISAGAAHNLERIHCEDGKGLPTQLLW